MTLHKDQEKIMPNTKHPGRRATYASVAGAAAIAALAGPAVAANASTGAPHAPKTVTAVTRLTSRPDSGAGGNSWAHDNFTRVATVTSLGGDNYKASLSDNGSFTTIPGQLTPNQSTPGLTIASPARTGSMSGYGKFVAFTASKAPNAHNVPRNVRGSNDPSYLWFELFFPSGTTFSANAGSAETAWSYSYSLTYHKVVNHRDQTVREHWTDAYNNGGGSLPGDGNITG